MLDRLPKWIFRFLELTCSEKYINELEGDLLELFERDLEQDGFNKAKQKFTRRALLSVRWYRLPKITDLHPIIMYKNYYKIAIRHALKHRTASMVHTLGLVLGLTAFFYIGLFIKHEWSFDKMHENSTTLYRVLRLDTSDGMRDQRTSSNYGATLKEHFPFIGMCRFGEDPVKMGEGKPFLVKDFYWADSTFFNTFTFKFLEGRPADCLNEVNELVITQSLKERLFGNQAALGKMVPVKVYDSDQQFLMKVGAVVEDPPKQTHIQFQALGPMQNAENMYGNLLKNWNFLWLRTYVDIPTDRYREVVASIPDVKKKVFGDNPPPNFGIDFQPFEKVYLYSQDIPTSTMESSIRNLQIFGGIGLLILLVSLLNYINLSTARSITRSKEIGIRKVLGSSNTSIFSQFIIESLLFTFAGATIAFILVKSGLGLFNSVSNLNLSLSILNIWDYLGIFAAMIIIGILTGIIPALIMIKIPVLAKAKSQEIQFKIKEWPITRRIFVGVQYFVALALLAAALVVHQQYKYLKNYDLGFNPDQLINLVVEDRGLQEKMNLIKSEVGQLPGVIGTSATGEKLPSALNNTWFMTWNGAEKSKERGIDIVGVDQDYFELLDIPIRQGENFKYNYDIDSARSVILNQTAFDHINKPDILYQNINIGQVDRKLIGVVEDYHNTDLHAAIVPLAYMIFPPGMRVSADNLLVKVQTENLPEFLNELKQTWSNFSADPINFEFVDESFAAAYAKERRFSVLIGSFTLIAIVISIIGLYGLISFIVQLKLKEICIRQVLGASLFNLMKLLGNDFFKVFAVASVLAFSIAYYLLNIWLDNYIYHINISGISFLIATIICLGISVLVIYFHLNRNRKVSLTEIINRE